MGTASKNGVLTPKTVPCDFKQFVRRLYWSQNGDQAGHRAKVALCRLLWGIYRSRAFVAWGFRSFNGFARAHFAGMSLKTARDYCSIGRAIGAHHAFLQQRDTLSQCSLSKLRYLSAALARHCDPEDVRAHLINDSVRAFASYSRSGEQEQGCRDPDELVMEFTFEIEDDTLVARAKTHEPGVEVVWFNPDAFPSGSVYRSFTEQVAKCALAAFSALESIEVTG